MLCGARQCAGPLLCHHLSRFHCKTCSWSHFIPSVFDDGICWRGSGYCLMRGGNILPSSQLTFLSHDFRFSQRFPTLFVLVCKSTERNWNLTRKCAKIRFSSLPECFLALCYHADTTGHAKFHRSTVGAFRHSVPASWRHPVFKTGCSPDLDDQLSLQTKVLQPDEHWRQLGSDHHV